MDFFERQEVARRTTTQLLCVFLVCVLAVMASVYAVVAAIVATQTGDPWDPAVAAGCLLFTGILIGGGSLWKCLELRERGGPGVAEDLGGQAVNPATQDPAERRLLNVVEEMALASSIRVPQIYVLREDASINAFAAGHTQDQAAIGVTKGCLEQLRRDELQGVIAHEFSHIVQGDMALNMRLIGWLHGILMLSLTGYGAMRAGGELARIAGRSRSKGQGNIAALGIGILLLGAALWAIGSLGVFFGRLLQAAVSRQREYLADAAAVQFTRNPDGLAGALKKLLSLGSKIQSSRASEAGHLFFGTVMPFSWAGLLATHPPLEDRIRLLDPAWEPGSAVSPPPSESSGAEGSLGLASAPPTASADATIPGVTGEGWSLPQSLCEAAHELAPAAAMALGILFDANPAVQSLQWRAVESALDPRLVSELRSWLPDILALPARARLPLLDLTIPTLRGMAPEQYTAFRQASQSLIAADGAISLQEFAMHFVLLHQLDPHFCVVPPPVLRHHSAATLQPSWILVAAALAQHGSRAPEQAQSAFASGCRIFSPGTAPIPMPEVRRDTLHPLEAALAELHAATPRLRALAAQSFWAIANDDRILSEAEACLLRATLEALGATIPRSLGAAR